MSTEMSNEEIQEIRADVAKRYNTVFPDVVLEPLWWGRRPVNRAKGRYAIVDQNNDHLFNVCTDIYKPVYHELVIRQVEDAAAMMPEFGKAEIKFNLMDNGGKLKVNVRFPEVDYTVKSGDVMNPCSGIFSSYDLGWKYKMNFGAYRLICSNGLTVGEIFDKFKRRHLVSLDPQELVNRLSSGMAHFSDQVELWKKWADSKVTPLMYEDVFTELDFSDTEKAKIEQTVEIGSTLILPEALKSGALTIWDLNSVLTQYVTHDVASELRKVELFPKITAALEKRD